MNYLVSREGERLHHPVAIEPMSVAMAEALVLRWTVPPQHTCEVCREVAKPITCGFRAKPAENSSLLPAIASATTTAGRLTSAPSTARRDSSFFVMSGPRICNRHDNGNPLFARTDGQSDFIE